MRLREVGKLRLLCFDLENRPLAYWYDGETTSQITAFGWKWRDEPDAHSLLLTKEGRFVGDDGRTISERAAYTAFRLTLSNADIVYGHNIRRHDLPMFQSWLLRLQLPTLPPILTSDTLRDIPKRNGLSASLANLAAMYGLEDKQAMSQPAWEEANKLTTGGLALARQRVVSDVLLQERLRDKLLELNLLGHPRTWRS
jgi:hypothetical protein